MVRIFFGLLAVTLSLSVAAVASQKQSRKPASVACTRDIQEAASQRAKMDGLDNCHIGVPTLSVASGDTQQQRRTGSIGLLCQRHISEVSVISEPVSYVFSIVPGSCSSISISGSE